jgi:hypothetical protein
MVASVLSGEIPIIAQIAEQVSENFIILTVTLKNVHNAGNHCVLATVCQCDSLKASDSMANVILALNDQDQELYQKIRETASQQNISASILQRNILCEIFNVPKDQTASTQYHLLHEIAYKQSIEQNIPVKSVIRSCFREYFDMPVRSKLQYEKKGWPLQKREKRFQVLSFLVIVDAATRQEIADQLKTTRKSVDGVLSFNSHYFESFRIPYDKQHRWRVTELGKKDYFDILKKEQAVRESEIEEAKVEEAEKPNRRHTKSSKEAEDKTGIV